MLRLSREADYGIVLMTRLAVAPDGVPQPASELAGGVRLSPQMTSKILKRLTREELLVSHRGVNGGYRLAKIPADITVADIIAAIEGPIGLTRCIDHVPGACEWEETCGVRANWQLINRRVLDSLATITLAEMAGLLPVAAPVPLVRRAPAAVDPTSGPNSNRRAP